MNKLAIYIEKYGIEKSAGFLDRVFGRQPTADQVAQLKKATAAIAKTQARQLAQLRKVPHLSPTVWNELRSSLELANHRGAKLEEITKLRTLADSKRSSISDTYFGGANSPIKHDIAAKKLFHEKSYVPGLGRDLNLEDNFRQSAVDGASAAFDKHLGNPYAQEAKARFLNPITEQDHRLRRQFERNYMQNTLEGKPTELLIKTPTGHPDIRETIKLPYAANSRGAEFDVKAMFGKDLGKMAPTFNKKMDELQGRLKGLRSNSAERKIALQDISNAKAFKKSFGDVFQNNSGFSHQDLNDAVNPRSVLRIRHLLSNPMTMSRLAPAEVKKALKGIQGILKSNPEMQASDAFASYMGHAAANPADSRILEVVKHRRMDSDEAKTIFEGLKKAKSGPADERWRKWTDAGAVGVLGTGAASVPYLYFKDEASDQ